ncbi:MAG TPA: hypothetical protein PK649_02490 [Vicingus sp.]|nr:hypothetical protein [Vicingus sp.]HRP58833.1 hypothetical protein [Vicingus sp.]
MSDDKHKHPKGKPQEKPLHDNHPTKPLKESWIGESKSQQEELRKASEIPPPVPKKGDKK